MRKNNSSIDGFVPRSGRRELGAANKTTLTPSGESNRAVIGRERQETITSSGTQQTAARISRREVDDSLIGIDQEDQAPKKKRGLFGRKRGPVAHPRRRKIIKRGILLIILIVLIIAGYVVVKGIFASNSIFKGSIFDIVQSKPLNQDANGRTNILVFGTSGSIDDSRHPGANLTDTLMVMSVDQNKKNAYLISLPRDLYVEYGATCLEGNRGKINSMYQCLSDDETNEEVGAKGLEAKIAEVTGLDIQYYAHINWAVVVGAVDAVGGVDVNVQGDGGVPYGVPAGSIYDVNLGIKYTAGVHHMNGTQALLFSRARGAEGGYGLAQGDFDRQANQQKVLVALRQKAASADTLTNVGKVTGLIDALGQNLKTDFATSEIQTLMKLARDIPTDKITQIDLHKQDDPQIVTGNIPGAGSTQVPALGTYDYSGIHTYINKMLNANDITREDAHVALFNGTGVVGYAQRRSVALENLGFSITGLANAPAGDYGDVEIYDLTKTKTATKAKLESIYGVKAMQTESPVSVSADTDIVIIYGKSLTDN